MNQLLFTVLAVGLLGILLVPAHKVSINRQQVLLATEATSTATAIAQELMEEIIVRKFDENKCGRYETTNVATDFTGTLGINTGEISNNRNTFDDVDDFNGFTSIVSTPRLGNFRDSVRVYFVAWPNLSTPNGSQTFLKRIDVTVWSDYFFTQDNIVRPMVISKIISYRYRGGA